jgi:polyisoprenyl-teichoic acid--peptidoglycan teichoic acid transferase
MQRNHAIIFGVLAVVAIAVIGFLLLSGGNEEPIANPSVEPSAADSVAPSASASASASPELNADLLDRRWTVAYIGTDLNERRESEGHVPNADALMVVSVSADQSEVAMISLPRDTVDVPLPSGETYPQKINALYEEEGVEALVAALAELYQVPIDGYLVLDMDDFSRLVEAVDGVDVNPAEPLEDRTVQLDLPAGPQELDAATANRYVRTRVDQDYGRMARQQEVVVSLIERLTDPARDIDLRQVLDAFDSLQTDLPLDDLPTLLEVARRASDAEVRPLVIQPPLITFEGNREDGRGYILEPDVEAIRAEVADLIGQE